MSIEIAVILISICFSTIANRQLTKRNFLVNEANTATSNIFDQSWVTISAKSNEIEAYPGEMVELECEASGSPQPLIQFYNHVSVLSSNDILSGGDIMESSSRELVKATARLRFVVTKSDVIFCKATSGSKTDLTAIKIFARGSKLNLLNSNSFNLEASQPKAPRITFYDNTYLDNIGSTVTLPCSSIGSRNTNTIWLDVDEKVIDSTRGERFTITAFGHLKIKNIGWNDMGLYTCIVKDNFGEDTISTFLYPMLPEK